MGDWRAREAQNEARFREQNEWIEVTGASYGATEQFIVFVCECGDANCAQPIELTMPEYESVRAVFNRFAVAPNHENPESEVIVSENARFTIVAKITGPALEIARETDPRADPLPDAPLPDDTPRAAATATVTHQAANRRWMEERPRLVVESASRYRLVNERIHAVVSGGASEHEDPAEHIVVICECGHAGCTETISVPLSTYVWTWVAPARFVIVAGHELPEFERVVRDGEGYAIVEKVGEEQQLATEADPRRAREKSVVPSQYGACADRARGRAPHRNGAAPQPSDAPPWLIGRLSWQ